MHDGAAGRGDPLPLYAEYVGHVGAHAAAEVFAVKVGVEHHHIHGGRQPERLLLIEDGVHVLPGRYRGVAVRRAGHTGHEARDLADNIHFFFCERDLAEHFHTSLMIL